MTDQLDVGVIPREARQFQFFRCHGFVGIVLASKNRSCCYAVLAAWCEVRTEF
ncbi:hypothetical protein DICVIV_13961 [Dictyocaulus viviparus]|uniref:Uncharacterized protein n=1 Tax=Dictyocaulus viviparus TaxID=29172 RepID=A0A0D8X8L1_DICVI|nr:hypothetical protein DICVIV_13961 [Dictyocaulus viviparus]